MRAQKEELYLVGLAGAGNGGSCGKIQPGLLWKEIRLSAVLDPAHASIRHSWNLLLQHLCRINRILSCQMFSGLTVKRQWHREKVDQAHLKRLPSTSRLHLSLFCCEKLQTLAFPEDLFGVNAGQLYLFAPHWLCVSIFCNSVRMW